MDAQERVLRMCMQQHDLNCATNGADWINRQLSWWRPIWVEAGELMNHFGTWEWWKKTAPDMPQVKLEMVDIFHFGLSHLISRYSSVDKAVTVIIANVDSDRRGNLAPERFIHEVEAMAVGALRDKAFQPYVFFEAWAALGADLTELYRLYMAKNVLNQFRQDNGYKAGTYVKNWGGKEDNWHLAHIVEVLMKDPTMVEEDFMILTRTNLKRRYMAVGYGASAEKIVEMSR